MKLPGLNCFSWLFLTCAFLLTIDNSSGGKILVLHPMFAPSHIYAMRPLLRDMVDRGHHITVFRVDKSAHLTTIPNVTDILLDIDNENGSLPFFTHEKNATIQLPQNAWSEGNKFSFVPWDGVFAYSGFCKALFGNEVLVDSLRKQEFDIALVDLIYNECSLALAQHLGLPAVGYWAFSFAGVEAMHTTGSNLPSIIPHVFSHVSHTMTFMDRVWNFFLHIYVSILSEAVLFIANQQITTYLPDSPHPRDLLANLSGAIINSHPALDFPRNLPPTFMEVGGFHIENPKKLPRDLAIFMDSAGDEGVVVFSMGCAFNTQNMPAKVVTTYLRAFSRLPQKVLMRVEGSVPFTPKNVKIVKWLPQNDVLAHPSTRLFVTHCGMHGAMEAIHHSVPMVGIPIFLDQMDVMLRLKEKNVIVGVDKDADENTLVSAMLEAMNNKTYKENIVNLNKIMKHYNPRPRESAIWLLEHVMLTKGADHLKIRTRFLNRFQYLSLDVIGFYLLSFMLLIVVSRKIITKLDRCISPIMK